MDVPLGDEGRGLGDDALVIGVLTQLLLPVHKVGNTPRFIIEVQTDVIFQPLLGASVQVFTHLSPQDLVGVLFLHLQKVRYRPPPAVAVSKGRGTASVREGMLEVSR